MSYINGRRATSFAGAQAHSPSQASSPSQVAMAAYISQFFASSQKPISSFTIEPIDKKTSVIKQIPQDSIIGTPIFSVYSSSSKPHLTITRPYERRDVIATVTYHSLSSKIEISFHGQHIQLKRKDMLSSAHSFHDLNVGELRWKESSNLLSSGLVLLDKESRELCRYKKRQGFDVLVSAEGEFLYSILITGLAAVEYKRRGDHEWNEVLDWL